MFVFIDYQSNGKNHKAVLNLDEIKMKPIVNTNKAILIYPNGITENITINSMKRI